MKHDHRSGPLDASALHLLHRAGQCAEVLFTNEAAKADLTPRQYAVLVCVAQNPDISQTGPGRADRRRPLHARRHRAPAGQEGPAAEKAHAARRPHVCGPPHRQGPERPEQRQAAGVQGRSAHPVGAESDQRGGFIDALGEIVRAMSRVGRAEQLALDGPAWRDPDAGAWPVPFATASPERALDDGARIGPVQSLAVGLARRAGQPRADERVGNGGGRMRAQDRARRQRRQRLGQVAAAPVEQPRLVQQRLHALQMRLEVRVARRRRRRDPP